MKILISSDLQTPYIGGGEVITFNVAKKLVEFGNKVTWVGSKIYNEKDFEVIDGVEIKRVWVPFNRKYMLTRKFYPVCSFFPLLKIVKHYDIVQFTTFVGALNGGIVGRLSKKSFVCLAWEFFRDLWNKFSTNYMEKIIYPKIEELIAKSYPYFITISEYTKKSLIEMGVDKDDIKVIYPGVNHSLFHPMKNRTEKKTIKIKYFIGWAGRLKLSYSKNLTDLLEAFKIIKKEVDGATLVLAGTGFKEFASEIEKRGLKIGSDVIYVGEIPHEKMPHFYQKLDLYLLPSLSEGFGMVALESQACGVPVVCYKVGALPEVVKNKKTGIVVNEIKVEKLAEGVINLLLDENKKKKMGKECIKWSEKFSWDNCVKEYIKTYENLLGR